jgi:hypothetical protein
MGLGMRFQIISGTAIQEFVEQCETATNALDRVRALTAGRPNVRILIEDGRPCSLMEIEERAEDEADGRP